LIEKIYKKCGRRYGSLEKEKKRREEKMMENKCFHQKI